MEKTLHLFSREGALSCLIGLHQRQSPAYCSALVRRPLCAHLFSAAGG